MSIVHKTRQKRAFAFEDTWLWFLQRLEVSCYYKYLPGSPATACKVYSCSFSAAETMSNSWQAFALALAVVTCVATADDSATIPADTTRDPKLVALENDVNQHWMIYAGSIVFLMQAGFSLLEAGSVSAKSATNILFKNILVRAFATHSICR